MKPSRNGIAPEIYDRFRAYHEQNPAWGVLHVVLDDGNWKTIDGLVEHALGAGDVEGAELAKMLIAMSVSQRMKIARRA